jgi:hypothetical protein
MFILKDTKTRRHLFSKKQYLTQRKKPPCTRANTEHATELIVLIWVQVYNGSRDNSVGIATGYGLDDRGVGFRVPVGARIFSSNCRPHRFWGPPSLLSNGNRGLFPGRKAAEAWSSPLTSNYCRGQENILSPIRLHGVVLNYLSIGTTLPFFTSL